MELSQNLWRRSKHPDLVYECLLTFSSCDYNSTLINNVLTGRGWTRTHTQQHINVLIFAGFGVKERLQIVALHNRLRSRVQPVAANMQKTVCGNYCVFLCLLNVSFMHINSIGLTVCRKKEELKFSLSPAHMLSKTNYSAGSQVTSGGFLRLLRKSWSPTSWNLGTIFF